MWWNHYSSNCALDVLIQFLWVFKISKKRLREELFFRISTNSWTVFLLSVFFLLSKFSCVKIQKAVLVKTLDCFWRDHLINMNRLSSAVLNKSFSLTWIGLAFSVVIHNILKFCLWQVNVRSFGHRNPLEEYKIDGCRFFISMLSATRRLTIESLLQYWSSPMESQEIFLSDT